MTNERLIEILNYIHDSKEYRLIIDGETATICDGWVYFSNRYGEDCEYPLSSLRIVNEHDGTEFYVMLRNDSYTLEIAKVVDINSL